EVAKAGLVLPPDFVEDGLQFWARATRMLDWPVRPLRRSAFNVPSLCIHVWSIHSNLELSPFPRSPATQRLPESAWARIRRMRLAPGGRSRGHGLRPDRWT